MKIGTLRTIGRAALENDSMCRCIALAIVLLFWVGCDSQVVHKASFIKRDATLTCPSETPDHCAIWSEFQDIADLDFSDNSDNTHHVSILDIGEDALLTRIHLIRAARESIMIQTFIWDDDEVGQLVFLELLAAARRGVKVRLILDQVGTYIPAEGIAKMAAVHENIDIELFRPVMERGGKSATREISTFITNSKVLNKRMHNKLFVVDGRIGIVGGRNVQNAYYDYDPDFCFKDLDLLVIGPEVQTMVKSFDMYWEHRLTKPAMELADIAEQVLRPSTESLGNVFDEPVLPALKRLQEKANAYSIVTERSAMNLYSVNQIEYVADGPKKNPLAKRDRWNSTHRVEELVKGATEEILMQTPYLIQDRKGIRDLKSLRKERPRLRIALSTNSLASTDIFFVYAMCFKQRQFYLETAQAQMYEFKPIPGDIQKMVPRYAQLAPGDDTAVASGVPLKGPRLIVHAKFFVVDHHISFVGSHNFDPRAKNLNTENAVIIWDDEFAGVVEQIFDRDTAPQNSWVVARRQKVPLLGNVSELVAAISSSLPFFDVWPFEYSTNFELREGYTPLPPDHPDFYQHYRDVGIFPQMDDSYENIATRFVKAFGGLFIDLM